MCWEEWHHVRSRRILDCLEWDRDGLKPTQMNGTSPFPIDLPW